MSVGGSLSGVTFGGISSGIDTDGIISRLEQLERMPIRRIQSQQAQLAQTSGTYANLLSQISSVGQSLSSINMPGAFNPINATSSNSATATFTATNSANPGTYNLTVKKLATVHKVATSAQANIEDPLGKAGSFVVNGKTVTVEASDSLRTLSGKINDLNAGVTASLLNGGDGNAFLTFTASDSGVDRKVQFADLSGDVLADLGVLTGATSIRSPITNGALGRNFASSSETVEKQLSGTGLTSKTIKINGTDVALNLSTDSLQVIADKINAASTGATASVDAVVEGATTSFRLKIVGPSTPTLIDDGGTLQALGVLQRAPGNSLVAAQDAEYTLDGLALKSSSNTVTNVIPGATFSLLKANETTPETATLTLRKDNVAIKSTVNNFVQSYNTAASFIRDNSKFDPDTFRTGPLFGDPSARQFESAMSATLFDAIPGLTGPYTNLASIGFGFDDSGNITVDDTIFDRALAERPEDVRKLFQSVGSSTNPELTFVSSTSKTDASSATGFEVNITQIATKSSYVGVTAQSLASTTPEQLTFTGTMFGSAGISVVLDIGSTASSTVDRINSDSRLRDYVTASLESGKLRIDSKRFGTSGTFSIVSNQSETTSNSGLGAGETGTKTVGVNVAGTIGGQAATGFGQFLSGSSTNTVAEGLQIQYTGSTLGQVGPMVFTKGMSSILAETISSFNDSANGLLVQSQKGIQTQLDGMDEQIRNIEKSVELRTADLRRKFAAMEEAMSRSQAQSAQLSRLTTQSNS